MYMVCTCATFTCFMLETDKDHVFPHYGHYASPMLMYYECLAKSNFWQSHSIISYFSTKLLQVFVFPLYRLKDSHGCHNISNLHSSKKEKKKKHTSQFDLKPNIIHFLLFSHFYPMFSQCLRWRPLVISQDAIQYWYSNPGCIAPTSQRLDPLT